MRFSISLVALFSTISIANGQTVFGNNLIVNAGAESGPGGNGLAPATSIPGWSKTGACDVFAYATAYLTVNALGPQDIEPEGQGNNYFAGGTKAASCTFTQSIDISSGATTIDAGTATFSVAGYFGAYSTVSDNATLTVAFQGASGNQLSTVTTGGVGANDRPQASGLYFRRQIGQVPAGARKAAVTLNMNWVDGSDNEAFADNLALILNAPASAQSLLGGNLIVNPGADASPGVTQDSPNYVSNDLPG